MMDGTYLPPQNGELKADDVTKYFTNVTDDKKNYIYKSQKRSRILEYMKALEKNKALNKCTLEDGRVVPIIVIRKYDKRPQTCYFNTKDAPKEEILKAFAKIYNIDFVSDKPESKKEGELIAQEVLHLLDNVNIDGKKVTGDKKRATTIKLFQDLYKDKQKNICFLSNGEYIPIIVKRTGENNKIGYYLNSSRYRTEVLYAFAKATNCTYLEYKENDTMPEKRKQGELTARDCVKIFHDIAPLPIAVNENKISGKEKLLQWFNYIYYERPDLNKVKLPNRKEIKIFVRRISHSQRCICLNTEDAMVKPFILKRVAELSKSKICLDNLDVSNDDKKQLYKLIYLLALASKKATLQKDKDYYHAYAQKAFLASKVKTNYIKVDDYLQDAIKKKR